MIFSLPPVRADGDFREGLLCVRLISRGTQTGRCFLYGKLGFYCFAICLDPRFPDETEQYLPDIRFDDVEDKTIQKKIQKLKKNFEMAVKILDNYARLLYYK